MDDDSDVQESPKASSYCMIDTPEKEKQKPLTREEDLPSAEETEEKEGEDKEKKEKLRYDQPLALSIKS